MSPWHSDGGCKNQSTALAAGTNRTSSSTPATLATDPLRPAAPLLASRPWPSLPATSASIWAIASTPVPPLIKSMSATTRYRPPRSKARHLDLVDHVRARTPFISSSAAPSRHEPLILQRATITPSQAPRAPRPPMSAAADDLARRVAALLPVPLPPAPQKQQLSGVAAAVLDAGGRLGRAVGDVFRRLRIDDTFYSGAQKQRRSAAGRSAAGASSATKEGAGGGGGDPLGASGRFARAQGSMNLSATYDSRTNDVESSVVARGDLWRAEASHSGSHGGASGSAPRGGAGDGANLFLVQLGPVLFVRDTTLLFPVHLSKRHLIWYGFERKNGVHSVCPAYWSAHKRWFFMSMLCLNPFACSFMDMQFPNGQLRYVAGDGFTTRAFLPLRGGILQAHGKFPGEKRLSFSFKNRSGGSVVPMVQWPDRSLSLGLVQPLSWRRSGLMLQPETQISICPTIGGRHPGVCMEVIHSANDNVGVVCGYSHTASPSAHASISIGRSKLNGGAARSGLVLRVDAPLHGFGRPWFSAQMNSGIEF